MEYLEFIENKKKVIKESGISINELNLNPLLKDFQKFIVTKALNNGKFAIFADCGLGKTFMQLEWAYQVSKYTNKPVLIINDSFNFWYRSKVCGINFPSLQTVTMILFGVI
jgi:superfamily II DNA or RNA helicase